jgi:hypothetical protein
MMVTLSSRSTQQNGLLGHTSNTKHGVNAHLLLLPQVHQLHHQYIFVSFQCLNFFHQTAILANL